MSTDAVIAMIDVVLVALGLLVVLVLVILLVSYRAKRRRQRQIAQLGPQLSKLDLEAKRLFDGTRRVRQVAAAATGLRERIARVVKEAQAFRKLLPDSERRLLDRLKPLASRDGFERRCEQANRRYETAEARKNQAAQLAPRLAALDQEVSVFFSGNRYVHHWAANGLRERIADAVEQARAVPELLPERASAFLNRLRPLASQDGFKRRCEQANRKYEAAETRKKQAAQLAPQLAALDREASALFDGERYVRHSAARQELRERIADFVKQGKTVRKWLPEKERRLLKQLVRIASPEGFERHRDRTNRKYVNDAAASVRESCGPVKLKPTVEQAKAIATDEDVTLVLAGAGSGKTTVIVGKVAHLVRDRDVRPDEILVLAFNRAAADQIAERLPTSMVADADTFHSFGNRVLGRTKSVSKLAEDDAHRRLFITQQLESMLRNDVLARPVLDFITSHLHPYRSPFDFTTADEYESHVLGVELRALSGDLVRSFEELAIANFLTLNGVQFRYERAYPHTNSIYRPDFYTRLPHGEGVYIEHFALDRDGKAPWPGYLADVNWKRRVHGEYGTTLIETYGWQHQEGVLLPRLRRQLEAHGVEFRRQSAEAVIECLHERFLISPLADLLDKFLMHVRSSRLQAEVLRQRAEAEDSSDRDRAGVFLDVVAEVQQRYEQKLASDGEIDYHDQIHGGTDRIRDGRWRSPYRYVLVDEFQDISAERMAMLAALCGPGTAFFLVGDDWQSIYRFTRSDVGLMRNCGNHLGQVQKCALTQTFRFGPDVSEPSAWFIRRNPTQSKRELRPAPGHPPSYITAFKTDDSVFGLERALSEISDLPARIRQAPSVLVLGRYNDSSKLLRSAAQRSRLVRGPIGGAPTAMKCGGKLPGGNGLPAACDSARYTAQRDWRPTS